MLKLAVSYHMNNGLGSFLWFSLDYYVNQVKNTVQYSR